MAVAAIVVAGGLAGAAVATAIGVSVATAVVAGAVIGYMAADTIKAIISPDPFDQPSLGDNSIQQQNAGLTVSQQGTDNFIPVVYGTRKLAGTRVFISTSGTSNRDLYVAQVICEGEISAITKIYINDELVVDTTTTHGQTYRPNSSSKYRDAAEFQVFHGTSTQTASSLLKELASWTDNHRLQGLCYIACKFKYPEIKTQTDQDNNPWTGGLPNVTVEVQGRRVALVSSFSDSVTRATSYADETTAFSANPIDCLLDYLRNPIYGKGLANDKINFKSFRDARLKWDKYADGSDLPSSYRHEFNGVIFTDRTIMDNVKGMLKDMRSSLPYSQGRYRLAVEDNGNTDSIYYATSTSVMTLDHTNIISEINIQSENTDTKYNRVTVTYFGGGYGGTERTYEQQEISWPPAGSSEETQYLTEDNGRLNEYTITLESVTSPITAEKMAKIILLKSRTRGKTIGLTGDSSLAKLDVGDIITIQYGYDTQAYPTTGFTQITPSGMVIDGKFRVTNIAVNSDFTFTITAEEHADNVYGQAPTVVNRYLPVTRAAAGSGQVADIYYPSPQANGVPSVTVKETYWLNPQGQYEILLSFYYVSNTTSPVRLTVDRQLPGATNYVTYQLSQYNTDGTATLERNSGYLPNSTYRFRAYNVTYSGTKGSVLEFSYTTSNYPGNYATYSRTATF